MGARPAPVGIAVPMPKDRDQLTPADPDDAEHLATHRGQGTGGSGRDEIIGEDETAQAGEPVEPGDDSADDSAGDDTGGDPAGS